MKKVFGLIFAISVVIAITACSTANDNLKTQASENVESNNQVESVENIEATQIQEESFLGEKVEFTLGNGNKKTIIYDSLDLEPEFDGFSALTVDLGNPDSLEKGAESIVEFKDGDVSIKAGGIYVLKGNLTGGQVKIVDGFGERIQVVLSGVNIATDKENAIVSDCNARVLIRLADASINKISSINDSASKLLDAAILVKKDLTINGEGQLDINGRFGNAIQSKNLLTFISGNYNIDVPGDGIKGKNGIIVKNGIYNINSGDEGFKATDASNGFIFVDNGEFNINSKGKGMSAENEFVLNNGNVVINADKECFEGKTVDIFGGKMELKTNDDAINATDPNQNKKSNQIGVYVSIKGGEFYIDSVTDGIDSNGDLYLDGGTIFINGPIDDNERIIDYNGIVRCSGVDMIAVGPGAKMQDLGDAPSQNYIVVYKNEMVPAGRMTLKDEKGEVVLTTDITKGYKAAIITSPGIEIGKTYTLEEPNSKQEISVSSAKTVIK